MEWWLIIGYDDIDNSDKSNNNFGCQFWKITIKVNVGSSDG